jgi:hypothetical protein
VVSETRTESGCDSVGSRITEGFLMGTHGLGYDSGK